jgi:hypothetical protein
MPTEAMISSWIHRMDPEPAYRHRLEFLASTQTAVVVDSGWRHNPAVDPAVRGFSRSGALIEVRSKCSIRENLVNASLGLLDHATTFGGASPNPDASHVRIGT